VQNEPDVPGWIPEEPARPHLGRSTAKATKRRRELVHQAAEIFDSGGYHTTSMDRLAETLGVGKGTLYHYFSGKEDVLQAIHEEFIDLLSDMMKRRSRLRLTPEQSLLEVISDIIAVHDTHRGNIRAFYEHRRELSPAHRAAIDEKRDRYRQMVEDEIHRGIDEGAFRQVDTRLATLALFGIANWSMHWYRTGGPLTARDIAYVFWDIYLHGVAAPLGSPLGENGAARPPARTTEETGSSLD